MSLAIEIIEDDLMAVEDKLFSYELPSRPYFNTNEGLFEASWYTGFPTASRDVSPTRVQTAEDKRKSLSYCKRNDSACDIFDGRPCIAFITTVSSLFRPSDNFQHRNRLKIFSLGPEGIELAESGASRPTAESPGHGDFNLVNADYFIVAVPTAVFLNGTSDVSAIELALEVVARYAKPDSTVIIESTVPVGTTRRLLEPLMRSKQLKGGVSPKRPVSDDYFAHRATGSFPPQNFIAGLDDIAPGSLSSIHALYTDSLDNIVPVSSPETAEMATLHETGQRMTAVAYANEMTDACAPIGIDPFEICAVLSNRSSSLNAASSTAGFEPRSTIAWTTTTTSPGVRHRPACLVAGSG